MGSLLSKNKSVIQIENKKLTLKEFRELKSYRDVLRVAGYTVSEDTTLRKDGKYFNACEPFQFGGVLIHDNKAIYIEKLY